ncbi:MULTISPECIES: RHS repeat domain-containing protein [Butyrivibrio]|uniref:RHS repeat domain-containing protein n=1 Tax=Butyrivibrio TaxID=830 RepID=UPI00041F26FB|nr:MULTISPECIES: RHS repeat-associated core domain-containing protein [Butyrivibrio]
MSKSGNNFYYIQDELGSPMYMTGTDGAVVSSYAFDDFGRNIDPFTGNIRNNNSKHAYTKQGNIIQPFAFTGYQEDEVSGLKFAQARFYSTDNGRFVGEDQFPGLLTSASTLNKFLYCENSPIDFVDNNGKWLKLKDFDINDGLGVAAVTVGAVAATVGAIGVGIALTATAPISLPVLACCGAAVGAGIACDASIISDWKKGEHANLIKAAGNTLAGAMIGGAVASGVGAVVSGGVTTLGTVSTAIMEHKDILTATVGGTISAVKGNSFSSGFFSTYINCKVTSKIGGAKGNFLGGATGSTVADAITSIENGESISVKKVLGKATLSGIAQALISGPGDWISDVFNSANPSASEQLLWYAIHDTKNIGILSEAAGWIIDNIIDDKNNCEG